jgi:hypothetical protein
MDEVLNLVCNAQALLIIISRNAKSPPRRDEFCLWKSKKMIQFPRALHPQLALSRIQTKQCHSVRLYSELIPTAHAGIKISDSRHCGRQPCTDVVLKTVGFL